MVRSAPVTWRSDGGAIRVRFRHDPPPLCIPAYARLAVPPDTGLRDRIADAIVLVGTSAAGRLAIRATAPGEAVPGVSIHARIIERILPGTFLTRGDLVQAPERIGVLLVGALVPGVMLAAGPAAALFLGGLWLAFREHGVLFDATFPLIRGAVVFGGLDAFRFLVPDHPCRACVAALRRRGAPDRVTHRRGPEGGAAIAVAVGAGSGEVCVGNMDSRDRFNHSVIGHAMNVAARMEAMCRHVRHDVRLQGNGAEAAGDLAVLDAGMLAPKGGAGRAAASSATAWRR